MSALKFSNQKAPVKSDAPVANTLQVPRSQLLTFGVAHHMTNLIPVAGSINQILNVGCTPTLHGFACPVRRYAFNEIPI